MKKREGKRNGGKKKRGGLWRRRIPRWDGQNLRLSGTRLEREKKIYTDQRAKRGRMEVERSRKKEWETKKLVRKGEEERENGDDNKMGECWWRG